MLSRLLDRIALRSFLVKEDRTNFDISWAAMRAAIRDARADLPKLKHIALTDDAEGDCFCMSIHRVEAKRHSIVSLKGLVERKLGLPVARLLDVMRDAPDNSLWDLFHPEFPPNDYDKLTPADAVRAIDRWFAGEPEPWAR